MRQKKKLQKFSMKKPSDRFLLPLLVMLWGAPQSISVAPCQQAPDATGLFRDLFRTEAYFLAFYTRSRQLVLNVANFEIKDILYQFIVLRGEGYPQ